VRWRIHQTTESGRFLVLLDDLCRGMEEPPQPNTERRRTLTADMVFATALKVYWILSSRRFDGQVQDAVEKEHVSHASFLCHNIVVVPQSHIEQVDHPSSMDGCAEPQRGLAWLLQMAYMRLC
jgi:hypothetical protein